MKPEPRHAKFDKWSYGIAMCGVRGDVAFAKGLSSITCDLCREKVDAMIAKRVASGLQRAPGGK